MKKYYDKILFLLGLAVLGIGAAFYYFKGGTPVSTPLPPMKLTGSAFDVIPSPTMEDKTTDWESPPDQGEDRNESGWTYYVFTPPKIWWQDGEGWTSLQPSGTVTAKPFGIHLVAAKKDLFRVQLLGIAGKGDPTDIIDFSDEESGLDFHLRVGEESPRVQIKVLDMTVDRVESEHGIIEKLAKVTILDERTNQNVTLVQGEAYSPTNNEYYILHISDPYPDQDWKVTKVGDEIDIPSANKISFVVTALDFDKPSVTVEKHSVNRRGLPVKPASRVLTLDDEPAPSAQPAPARSGRPTGRPAGPARPASRAAASDPFVQ